MAAREHRAVWLSSKDLFFIVPALVCLALFHSSAFAQEEKSTGELFTPSLGPLLEDQWTSQNSQAIDVHLYAMPEGPLQPEMSLSLTIRDAIRIALFGNYDILAEQYVPQVAELEIQKARGVFDTYLNSSYALDYTSELTSSQLQGSSTNILKTRKIVSEIGLAKMVETGGRLELKLDLARYGSNSAFLTLNPSYTTHLNFSIAQPLLKNAGFAFQKAPIRIAENRHVISEDQWKGFVSDTVFQVVQAYWDLVFAFQNLEVRQSSLNLARELLRENEARVRLGTLAPVELLQSRTGVSLREEEVLDADSLLQGAQDLLKGLLQWEKAPVRSSTKIEPVEIPPEPPEHEDNALAQAVDLALRTRPEYRAAQKDLETKNLQIKMAENGLLPNLDLTGEIGLNGLGGSSADALSNLSELDRLLIALGLLEPPKAKSPLDGDWHRSFKELFDSETYQWSVGIRFEMPLENRAAKSEYLQSKLEAYRSLWSLRSLEEKITLEVKEAWRAQQTNREKVRTSIATQTFARQQFEAEQKKLSLGLSTNYQLLKMEEDLRSAQINTLRAKIEYWKDRARFEKAKGSLLEREGIRIEDIASIRRG